MFAIETGSSLRTRFGVTGFYNQKEIERKEEENKIDCNPKTLNKHP